MERKAKHESAHPEQTRFFLVGSGEAIARADSSRPSGAVAPARHPEQLDSSRKGRAVQRAWLVIAGLSLLIGVVPLRYALPRVPHPAPLPNFLLHHRVLILHAVAASIALLLGPWQFLSGLPKRHPKVHRWMGRFYAAALLVAALAAGTGVPVVPR
jgi:hypothetical protein